MIRGQIASSKVVGTAYAEDIHTLWGIRQRLCSMAAPSGKRIYPEACRRCMHCAYGKKLLKLIEEGKIQP